MSNNPHLEQAAKELARIVRQTLEQKAEVEFDQDEAFEEKDIIEYNGRITVSGMNKFNKPCLVSSVSFYPDENAQKKQKANAAMILYLEPDFMPKVFKKLSYKDFNSDEDEHIFANCKELNKLLAEAFLSYLKSSKNYIMGEPLAGHNTIAQGVEFPYKEYQYMEIKFFPWNKPHFLIDLIIAK